MTQNYYEDGQWISKDTAYIETKDGFISNKTNFNNLYTCGVYNGNSNYAFTSVESTVCNAIKLIQDIEPEIGKQYKIKSSITLAFIIKLILLVILIIALKKLN